MTGSQLPDFVHQVVVASEAAEMVAGVNEPHVVVIFGTDPSTWVNGLPVIRVSGPFPDLFEAERAAQDSETKLNSGLGEDEPPFRVRAVQMMSD